MKMFRFYFVPLLLFFAVNAFAENGVIKKRGGGGFSCKDQPQHLLRSSNLVDNHIMTSYPYESCQTPPNKVSTFASDDVVVNWTSLPEVNEGDEVEWIWYNPCGEEIYYYQYVFDSSASGGNSCTWGWFELHEHFGTWSVKYYFNGKYQYTDFFKVVNVLDIIGIRDVINLHDSFIQKNDWSVVVIDNTLDETVSGLNVVETHCISEEYDGMEELNLTQLCRDEDGNKTAYSNNIHLDPEWRKSDHGTTVTKLISQLTNSNIIFYQAGYIQNAREDDDAEVDDNNEWQIEVDPNNEGRPDSSEPEVIVTENNTFAALEAVLERVINGEKIAAVNISSGSRKYTTGFSSDDDLTGYGKKIKKIVKQLGNHGVAVIYSAGNLSKEDDPSSGITTLAALPDTIAVGAASVEEGEVIISNTSRTSEALTLFAPGKYLKVDFNGNVLNSGIKLVSGTSFSAPIVTAAWSNLKSKTVENANWDLQTGPMVSQILWAFSTSSDIQLEISPGVSRSLIDVDSAFDNLGNAGDVTPPELDDKVLLDTTNNNFSWSYVPNATYYVHYVKDSTGKKSFDIRWAHELGCMPLPENAIPENYTCRLNQVLTNAKAYSYGEAIWGVRSFNQDNLGSTWNISDDTAIDEVFIIPSQIDE
ncbi:S8/S53 family peptidase [Desulfobacula phenolica]|uniref:Subtilase family protein n=1 Tax=Desulfobacula phenolica TaxID=90732 RepID=A0A1H2KEK6_9BACT|nr:S8/S53 family peptidase [Desulfobacula phenolica]SDU66868.1 Subtilase family protein [Desulfobacula phenolica]